MVDQVKFITSHFRFGNDYGGQRSRISHEALEEHYKVQSIVPGIDTLTGGKVDQISDDSVRYIETRPFDRNKFFTRLLSQFILATRLLFSPMEKRCLYVLNNNPPLVYLLLGFRFALFRYRYAIDVRDFPFHKFFLSRPILSFPLKLLDKFILRRRTGSISVSSGLRASLGLDGSKDLVVPLGFDNDEVYRAERIVQLNDAKLVYVGSLNSYFDLEAVCEYLKKSGFAGSLSYYGNANTQHLTCYSFFENKGILRKSELFEALKQYDLGVFPIGFSPTTEYLLGNKIFDYLKSGLGVAVFGSPASDSLSFVNQFHSGFRMEDADWAKGEYLISEAYAGLEAFRVSKTKENYISSIQTILSEEK